MWPDLTGIPGWGFWGLGPEKPQYLGYSSFVPQSAPPLTYFDWLSQWGLDNEMMGWLGNPTQFQRRYMEWAREKYPEAFKVPWLSEEEAGKLWDLLTLREASPILESAQDALEFEQLIKEGWKRVPKTVAELFNPFGGATVAARELAKYFAGQGSIFDIVSPEGAKNPEEERQAILAQILRPVAQGRPVKIGETYFNPYSEELATETYKLEFDPISKIRYLFSWLTRPELKGFTPEMAEFLRQAWETSGHARFAGKRTYRPIEHLLWRGLKEGFQITPAIRAGAQRFLTQGAGRHSFRHWFETAVAPAPKLEDLSAYIDLDKIRQIVIA